jgi:maltooligosyltrehalose synthase
MLLWKDAAVRIPTATYRLQLHKDFGFSYTQVLARSMRQLRRTLGL